MTGTDASSHEVDARVDVPETASGKASWSSLEVAKLLVAATFPVALAVMGWKISDDAAGRQRSQQLEDRTKENKRADDLRELENARARGLRWEQIARENATREREEARDARIRSENAVRDKEIRDEAFRRDTRARNEAVEATRYSTVLQKRAELWDRLYPKLQDLDKDFFVTPLRDFSQRKALATMEDIDTIRDGYAPYFSLEFREALLAYGAQCQYVLLEAIDYRRRPGPDLDLSAGFVIDDAVNIKHMQHQLVQIMRRELRLKIEVGRRFDSRPYDRSF